MLSLADGLTRDPQMGFWLRLVFGFLVGFQIFRVFMFLAEKFCNWSSKL